MPDPTSPISDEQLDALTVAAEAATGGPWHWAGNTDTGEPYLATWIPGAGRCQVLSIGHEYRATTGRQADEVRECAADFGLDPEETVRDWAHSATGEPIQEPRLQFITDLMLENARDLAVYEVAPEATDREDPRVYRADVVGIRHPDATYLAAAHPDAIRSLIARLRAAEQAIARVRALERHRVPAAYEADGYWPALDADDVDAALAGSAA
ncbi:hypothetical protein ACXR2T_07950 [Leucobacter sp. HY1910]